MLKLDILHFLLAKGEYNFNFRYGRQFITWYVGQGKVGRKTGILEKRKRPSVL